MLAPAIISLPASQRWRPSPKHGIDVNFCRNPQCDLFAEPPDPFKGQDRPKGNVKSNYPRGKVIGSGDEKSFTCGACGQSSIIKNNRAIVDEYRRLRRRSKKSGRAIAARANPARTGTPHRRIRILTDRADMEPDRRARLMRLATLRSVDAYFHKVRPNIRFAARPAHTPSGNGRAWDRHYLYNPETMVKVVEIYRFAHNWMGSSKTRETPAMKLGLTRGRMRASAFFG